MAKAVLTTKVDPTYDDLPEQQYHFPRTYLNQVQDALGDWIVYYEPRRQDANDRGRDGRQSYFAIARLTNIRTDTNLSDHYYAEISDFLEFDRAVPFREGAEYFESALQKDDGSTNRGAFGRAVRNIPDREFDLIVRAGFTDDVRTTSHDETVISGVAEEPAEFERPMVEQLVRRPFRDAAFSRQVSNAYEQTCALTGLKIINGGGRAEIEAAHIRPVGDSHRGPDSIRNGMALSRTVHWMFDRGLLTLSDDYKILKSSKIPDEAARLLNPDGYMRLPGSKILQPHQMFIRYHRENIFKE